MAKNLTIDIAGKRLELSPVKLERSKLYGHSELIATDPSGRICVQGGVNGDGVTLVMPGSVKPGVLTESGEWIERSELLMLHADGSKAEMVTSSFDSGITLEQETGVSRLLDLDVTAVYMLTGDDSAALAKLLGDRLFQCTFSYRTGVTCNDAFVLASDDRVFLIAGQLRAYDFLSIGETGMLDDEDDVAVNLDDIDFLMF